MTILNNQFLKNETPIRLGKWEHINSAHHTVRSKAIRNFASFLIKQFTASDGLINQYFSIENVRFSKNITDSQAIKEGHTLSSLLLNYDRHEDHVPFVPIVALSGGHDSGLHARLMIEAYRERVLKKTDLDRLFLVTFTSDRFCRDDIMRANQFAEYLVANFSEIIPISVQKLAYPSSEIEQLVDKVTRGYPLLQEKFQNLSEALTNTLISLPCEETGFHSSLDSTNLTEFFLDEVTNGSTGAANFSFMNGVTKSMVLAMCKEFGIYDALSSNNSTTWEYKAQSYIPDMPPHKTDEVFFAIETIHYLLVMHDMTPAEIHQQTGFGMDFIKNVAARLLNYCKRSRLGGQDCWGDTSPLRPKTIDYMQKFYPVPYLEQYGDIYKP